MRAANQRFISRFSRPANVQPAPLRPLVRSRTPQRGTKSRTMTRTCAGFERIAPSSYAPASIARSGATCLRIDRPNAPAPPGWRCSRGPPAGRSWRACIGRSTALPGARSSRGRRPASRPRDRGSCGPGRYRARRGVVVESPPGNGLAVAAVALSLRLARLGELPAAGLVLLALVDSHDDVAVAAHEDAGIARALHLEAARCHHATSGDSAPTLRSSTAHARISALTPMRSPSASMISTSSSNARGAARRARDRRRPTTRTRPGTSRPDLLPQVEDPGTRRAVPPSRAVTDHRFQVQATDERVDAFGGARVGVEEEVAARVEQHPLDDDPVVTGQ